MTPQTELSLRQFLCAPHLPARFALRVSGLSMAVALCVAASPVRAQRVELAANSGPAVAQEFAAVARASSPFAPTVVATGDVESSSSSTASRLPEAPSAPLRASFSQTPAGSAHQAPLYAVSVPEGWSAQQLTAGQKFAYSIRESYSFDSFAEMFIAAGWGQWRNGEPNYGTDRGAFGERLGASAIHETTENIFSDGIMAPILHEDPRYYVDGSSHNVVHRALYAATRPLITRTDSGHSTVNISLLTGYAASAAVTYGYYPPINQNFHDTAATYGDSLLGAALGFLYDEFSPDIYGALHLHKRQ
jgi:hypothetical protein